MNADITGVDPRDPPDFGLHPSAGRRGERCPLGLCDGSGFLVDEATNTAVDCGCRDKRIAAARTVRLEGRIPKRYRGVSFDRPPVPEMPDAVVSAVRTYVRNLDARLDEGRGLWLAGDVKTGKTTLAMLISTAAIHAGRSVAIYSLPRLLNLIRDEIGAENSLLDLLDSLSSVDLLHIDDLGGQHTTPWRLEQLYSIVDARYQAERAIIATTHLTPDKLARQIGRRTIEVADDPNEIIGKRIVSRLVDMCGDPLLLYDEERWAQIPSTAHLGSGRGGG